MSEWKEYKVEDIALDVPYAMSTGPFGSSISSKFFQEDGVPVIRGGNLSTDITERMSDDKLVFISKVKASEFKRSAVKSGDLIFTCWGTINQVGLITDDLKYSKYIISNKQMKLTVDPKKADPLFLYYLFSSPRKQAEILNNAIGAAVPGFNLGQLKKLTVFLPSIEIQQKISSILNSLDKKIRHGRLINQTLEHIALAIFKNWFVDFDPTRAKISATQMGHDPERAAMAAISGKSIVELNHLSSEHFEQLKAIAALFPDKLVDSDLGLVPEDWETKPFGDFLTKTIGGDWGKDQPDEKHTEKVKILRGTDLPNVYAGNDNRVPTRYVDPKKLASRKLDVGDIVIEVSGGSTNQPTGRSLYLTKEILERLDSNLEPASFCRLFRPIDIKYGLILGLHLQKMYADGKTWQYQNQSTGISNFQTKVFLTKELVVAPTNDIKNKFFEIVMPLIQKISSAENSELEKLRNFLLPKLLSGELSPDKFQTTPRESG